MRKLFPLILLIANLCTLRAQLDTSASPLPSAPKMPKDVSVHNDPRVDDYFWLRDKTNPEVLKYFRAENAYTAAVMKPNLALRQQLYDEMVGRIKETDSSAPLPDGDWLYFFRTQAGKQYRIYCRKSRLRPGDPEQVLLDLNQFAANEKYVGLGSFEVSDDGNRLAYSLDLNGHRDYELFVRDLRNGTTIPQKVGIVSSVAWAADNETIFFTKEDPVSKRSYHLGKCSLKSGEVTSIYDEPDEIFDIGLSRSSDRRYIFCTAESKLSTEVRALPSDQPAGAWRLLNPRNPQVKYFADHRAGLFYFRTNLEAKNYRIVAAPAATPDASHWKDFLAHQRAINVADFQLFANYAVISEREGGLPHLRVIDLKTHASKRLKFPEPSYEVSLVTNADFNTEELYYRYESPVTSSTVTAYNMATATTRVIKQTAVLGGYSAQNYTCVRATALATDGTKIPLTIVYRTNLRMPGPQALLLYGYGSYGFSIPDSFSSTRLSLLDRGVIYVTAHIRGGGELGEEWRDAGRMEKKETTFNDFIASAEYLTKAGYTSNDKLAILGGSAGGLLMGAVVNQRPDLFKAVVAKVPFVDVVNTMLDASLPLTTAEYIEWGNPNTPAEYKWIRHYSPYDNIKAQSYPALLVTTALNDSQVPFWEGSKFVAKLRALKTDHNPLLLKINLDPAGHGGASGRYDALKETAFDDAFILSELGRSATPAEKS